MPYPAALGQRPLDVNEAYAALEQYAADYGRDPLLLLMHASVPETLRPDLLNLIRVNFLAAHGPDPSLEADVLFSPLATALGGGYYRIDAQVRWHCLVMLRSLYRHDPRPRIRRIAELLWRYVEAREHQASRAADPQLAEFLDIQRWVALAFLEPASAAHAFADALRQTHADGSTVALRLGGLASAIELPLAGQPELLAYARGLDALASGNDAEAERLLGALGSDEIRVGDIVLKAPGAVLADYRAAGATAGGQESSGKPRRTCLVIQPVGTWTDPDNGHVVDLDAAYRVIRETAAEAGLDCIRADLLALVFSANEQWPALLRNILSAEVVICDLSTGDVAMRYLMGVCFALGAHKVSLIAEAQASSWQPSPLFGRVILYSASAHPESWVKAALGMQLTSSETTLLKIGPNPILWALSMSPTRMEAPPSLAAGTEVSDPTPAYAPAPGDLASVCPVIQGFGLKTDPVTGRSLDLDQSFAVIASAVTAVGFECTRQDIAPAELPSEALDLLLRAPLAIVDLSLGLPDVLIQLGLRHGLRPGRTLLLAEEGYRIPPELASLRILRYKHGGASIDKREADRLQAEITRWLKEAMATPAVDSPVYAALPKLRPPVRRPPAPQPETLAEDPVPPQSRPRVFISYVHEYRQYAAPLARALQAEGMDVAWDMDLKAGDNWQERLTAMLDEADVLVAVAGTLTAGRQNPLAEIERARQLGKRLFPVLVDPIKEPATLLESWAANTDDSGYVQWLAGVSETERQAAITDTARRIAAAISLSAAPAEGAEAEEVDESEQAAVAPTATWELTIRQRGEGALQFILLIDGERIEATVHFQRTLVDKLADELLAGIHLRTDAAQALRQLLLPRELIALGAPARYHLTLGPDTAALPWELIFHRPDDPFAHLGPRNVLRRLDGLREPGLRQSAGFQALLIGNPQTARSLPDHEEGLPLLGGVAQELDGVAHSLAAAGFEVGLSAEESASAVMSRLFALDYRVLLISGNSVHEHPIGGRRVSGFVLSDGVFLTALELRQMRVMPEVVFLNGCHAGRRVANASDGPPQDMVLELLKAGVKVVVAPGWAVDDMSAAQFSETFFTILATGRPFEEAVAGARVASYKAAPDLTTWAAYQAWGDPDYRLLPPPASEAA
ncbi:MAG: CHAT domain-containing protein [Zoogloea sp.]|nr:CHAT domain-containing protein [Zoogloea sp.]